jgi:3-oxoacyl-[acyl-carrier-protein] synthase-3
VAKLADHLKLPHANAMALSQQGCSGLLSAINLAARMVQAGDPPAALCVAGDALPKNTSREIMYNVMSDAAAAVVVERGSPRNQIVTFHQLGQPAYWDSPQQERELIAAYFPMAQRAICGAIEQAGLRLSDIRWIVPSNVSLRSWTILAELLGIPVNRIWSKNIARVGHTVCCDHVINLHDMARDGALSTGDHLLLFTFGFGASWTSLILQH